MPVAETTQAVEVTTTTEEPRTTPFTTPEPAGNATLASLDECGHSVTELGKVVGGTEAPLNAFPWQAALGYRVRQITNRGTLCSRKLWDRPSRGKTQKGYTFFEIKFGRICVSSLFFKFAKLFWHVGATSYSLN